MKAHRTLGPLQSNPGSGHILRLGQRGGDVTDGRSDGDKGKGDPKGKAGRCETHYLVGGPIMLFEGSVIETLDEIKSAPNTSLFHRNKLYILMSF